MDSAQRGGGLREGNGSSQPPSLLELVELY